MRLLVFFDLPTITAQDKREYRAFRKLLIKNGFFLMQESVYCRMILNKGQEEAIVSILLKNKPKDGLVQLLSITEKQFSNIKCIAGSFETDVLASDERVVVL